MVRIPFKLFYLVKRLLLTLNGMDKLHVIWGFQWILYCFIHSFLANNYIKEWFARSVGLGSTPYRIIYNIIAVVYLAVLLWGHFSLESKALFQPTDISRVVAVLFVLPGAAIMLLCIAKYFKLLSGAFGVETTAHLYTGGLHRFVRHPLYLGTFIFLVGLCLYWPLMKNFLVTGIVIIYTLAGTLLEEKKLLKEFGQAYKDYQLRVPMIFPRLVFRSAKTNCREDRKR